MTRLDRWISVATIIFVLSGPRIATVHADEMQVNTYTTGFQGRPAVAMDAAGGFVVVWHSVGSSGTDPDFSIQARRFDANESPLSDDFQVNTYTTGGQGYPAVAMDADGDFVVVWFSNASGGTDSSLSSVQGQRFASNGSPAGAQFQVNTYTTGTQGFAKVSMAPDGAFVVAWPSSGSGGSDSSNTSIQGQRFASDGSFLGAEFQVNTYTTNSQQSASVSTDADGNFVIVWTSNESLDFIRGQRYASDGSPLGDEFRVDSNPGAFQGLPSVAMDADGDFVVIWDGFAADDSDDSGSSIQGQRFASDGSPLGGQFLVNTYTTGSQDFASLSIEPDGDFIVAWESVGSAGTDSSVDSIQAQRYASDGSMIGGQFQVNTYTTESQRYTSVSAADGGRFVVVWHSDRSGGSNPFSSIQRTSRVQIFSDGFESGNTSAWPQMVDPLGSSVR